MGKDKKKKQKKRKSRRKGGMGGFPELPNTFRVSLKSTYRFNTSISAGAFLLASFSVSDLNEVQPYYYDQLLMIYRNWVVMGVSIEYRILNRSQVADAEVIMFDVNRRNYDAGITFAIAESLPGAKRHLLTAVGNSKTITVTRSISLSKVYKAGFHGDSDFWGDLYNSPNICIDLVNKDNMITAIGYTAADGTSSLNLTTDRVITYHVQFFNFWVSNLSKDVGPLGIEDDTSKPPRRDKSDPETQIDDVTSSFKGKVNAQVKPTNIPPSKGTIMTENRNNPRQRFGGV